MNGNIQQAAAGFRGTGEFFVPRATSGLRGLGAAAAPAGPTMDLRDKATVQEVKTAAAVVVPGLTATEAGQQTYTPAYYESGIWEPEASAVWFQASQTLATLMNIPAEQLTVLPGDGKMFPNASGLQAIASFVGQADPQNFAAVFPRLAAFASTGGSVVAPYYSITDRVRDEGRGPTMAAMQKMMIYGGAAVVLVGATVLLKKRKLRANRGRKRR